MHITLSAFYGVVVGLLAGLLNTLAAAVFLSHLFSDAGQLAAWGGQLTAWYIVLVGAGTLGVGLTVALFERNRTSLDRDMLSRLYFYLAWTSVAGFWLANIMNFWWLAPPAQLDFIHVGSNLLFLAGLVSAAVILAGKTPWPRSPGQRPAVSLVATLVVAAAAVAALRFGQAPPPSSDGVAPRSDLPVSSEHLPASTRQPHLNLLLLTVDTLRADHLGFYGYGRDTSPFLDSLASEGAVFDWAFTEKPRTSPSFASIMTSTYPRRHGIHNTYEVLAREHLTLAEILREAGYVTAAVVTNANLYPVYGFDQGFDRYFYGEHVAEEQTALALKWLKEGASEPFFLWVHYVDPHRPYLPPSPYDRRYLGGARAAPQSTLQESSALAIQDHAPNRDPYEPGTRVDWQIVTAGTSFDGYIARYDGEIRYTDDQIRRLVESIAPGRLNRTLLVFTADHGESFGEQGVFGHGPTAHDSNSRIPLVFRLPGEVPAAQRISAVAGGVDIAPTILELLGIAIPAQVQGRSRAGWIMAESQGDSESLAIIEAGIGFHIYRGVQQALRTRDWKYVMRSTSWIHEIRDPFDIFWFWNAMLEGGLARDEFYDLRGDPEEKTNALEAQPDRARQLREQLVAALIRQGPPGRQADSIDWRELKELSPETERALRSLGYVN